MSGASTPNARFTASAHTAEDLLSTQTVGLVALSDYRKRRAEAMEVRETAGIGNGSANGSGRGTPEGASTPPSQQTSGLKKKPNTKRRKAGPAKLSFRVDEEEEDDENEDGVKDKDKDHTGETRTTTAASSSHPTPASTPLSHSPSPSPSPRTGSPLPKTGTLPLPTKKKFAANTSVGVIPKALTKSALIRDAQAREALRKEFLARQEAIKASEVVIPFVFYDGTDIPGGVCKVKKGDLVWVFLDRSRKVGAEVGVGSRREWARVGVDDLMIVRGGIVIPHHYDFYYFIINRTLGPNNRLLFDYSAEPPLASASTPSLDTAPLETYNPLSHPSQTQNSKNDAASMTELEGANDDPSFTKVVDRRWYERNKHIFPASVWQEFDPEKDYQTEVKRDAGGNAFFFS